VSKLGDKIKDTVKDIKETPSRTELKERLAKGKGR
jgi:hypothetical protein